MLRRALGSLRLWKWITIAATSAAILARVVYGVLCLFAADQVFPGLIAMRHGCAVNRSIAVSSANYLGAVGRVATLAPFITALTIGAFVAFLGWARTAFSVGAAIAPRGTRLASPFEIVLMWLVPFIHLFMPFWYVRDLLRACDPADLEPVTVDTFPPGSYRTPGIETIHAWKRPWLPFRLWWALWAVSIATYPIALYNAAATWSGPGEVTYFRFEALRSVISVAATIVCVIVVHAATELIEERGRRLAALKQA
jgi:hypothetical protein